MATFIVRHSNYPKNPKKFTISLDKVAKLKGEPNTIFPRDKKEFDFWEIRIVPPEDALDFDGNPVKSLWIDTAVDTTINKTIMNGINTLSGQIDWSQNGLFPLESDTSGPRVTETYPKNLDEDFPIDGIIKIVLEDLLPASGIDLDSIKLYVDGIEVVPSDIIGNPFRAEIYYKPPQVIMEER